MYKDFKTPVGGRWSSGLPHMDLSLKDWDGRKAGIRLDLAFVNVTALKVGRVPAAEGVPVPHMQPPVGAPCAMLVAPSSLPPMDSECSCCEPFHCPSKNFFIYFIRDGVRGEPSPLLHRLNPRRFPTMKQDSDQGESSAFCSLHKALGWAW